MRTIAKIGIFFILLTVASLSIFYDEEKGYSLFVMILSSIHLLMGILLLFNMKIGRTILRFYIKPLYLGFPGIFLAKYCTKILDSEESDR